MARKQQVSRRFRVAITYAIMAMLTLTITLNVLKWANIRTVHADTSAQTLPFSQDWTNTGLITADDNWSGVPGVIGYRGDDAAAGTGVDPQTITQDLSAVVDVNANHNDPNTFITGGVTEFDGIANPVVALQGSGTADFPNLVISLDTTGQTGINVSYNLRDIDGSTDNSVQAVALQYRVGASGSYTNIPAAFVADASSGPSLATLVTPVSVTLPAAAPVAGTVINLSGSQTRKTITDENGQYHFDNVETNGFYTVTPSRANFSFSPVERSFSQLGNNTEAVFTGSPTGAAANALDTAEYFVRQHYLDFLGREPDESGFNFWSDEILLCGTDAGCIERKRINVSAAYFLSIEFQETGGLVDSLYRASYGRRPFYAEFVPDASSIAQGVVVGRGEWAEQLATNKQAFLNAWVQRAAFRAAYDGLTNDAFVDELISHTGVRFTSAEREALVSGLNTGASTRADVLRQIVADERFLAAKRNDAFVMMEYFGYLRRDPDESGYQFWLNKLNQFGGNFEQAEMVKAFLVSGEYRQRFRL